MVGRVTGRLGGAVTQVLSGVPATLKPECVETARRKWEQCWLPGQDSNLDLRIQSPSSYH